MYCRLVHIYNYLVFFNLSTVKRPFYFKFLLIVTTKLTISEMLGIYLLVCEYKKKIY